MPRKELTQRVVETLKPDPSKIIERPDHLYPSLRLIVQPSGSRAFAVRRKLHGKGLKITLEDIGLDLRAARERTRALLAEIAAGKDPRTATKRAKASTFGGLAELFLKDAKGETRPKTQIERERHLRRDWKPFHARPLAEIRRSEIAARLLEIKDEHGPIAANRSRTTLNTMFEWAIDKLDDDDLTNVVASTRRPLRKEPSRDRVLTPEERREILAATEDTSAYSAIVRLLLLTLQRREEVGGMRRSELDLDKALWELPGERTKNGLPHLVPLSRQALEIIRAQMDAQPGEFLFGQDGTAPFSGWSRCKRRLDRRILEARRQVDPNAEPMPHWQIHDLRRTGSTAMNEELGIQPHIVEAIINHISGDAKKGVAGTYNRAQYLKERTRALQAWADHVLEVDDAVNVAQFPSKFPRQPA